MNNINALAPVASDSQPDTRYLPEPSEEYARLGVLLSMLGDIGLMSALPDTQAFIARADQIVREYESARADLKDLRARLVADVANGSRGVLSATAELAESESGLPAPAFVRDVVAELRRRAVVEARNEGMGAHRSLARIADDAVRVAVAAGRKVIDVAAVKAALAPPARRRNDGTHPWLVSPPTLPTVTLEAVAGDPVKLAAWAQASEATARMSKVLEIAGLLGMVMGGSSKLFAVEIDADVRAYVAQLPELVQLAVADALGMRPGLYLDAREPSRPVTPIRRAASVVAAGMNVPGWIAK